jgi:ABC-type transport system involved in multi-copper enzyme maturation permease subunit
MQPALWIKAWMDTRWRFSIGALLFLCTTVFIVMEWTTAKSLIPNLVWSDYILSNVFQGNLRWLGVIFALLLGMGSMAAPGGRFLLALPALRTNWLLSRIATGLIELITLCLIPAIVLPLVSPAVNESYEFGAALNYGLSLFLYLAVLLSLGALLSCLFEDLWKPLLIGIAVAVVLGMIEYRVEGLEVLSVDAWTGRVFAALLTIALAWFAAQQLERQDF